MIRVLAILCVALTGCASVATYPLPTDPAVQYEPTELAAWVNAWEYAAINGGEVYRIRPTGSMEPTLTGGDYVVVIDMPWSEYVPPNIAQYRAQWLPPTAEEVLHRIALRFSDGLVMSGDANRFSESRYRVTEKDVRGILVGIWRVKP